MFDTGTNQFVPPDVFAAWEKRVAADSVDRSYPRLVIGNMSRVVYFMVSPVEGYATSYGCSTTPGTKVDSLRGMYDYENPEALADLTVQWKSFNGLADLAAKEPAALTEKHNALLNKGFSPVMASETI